MPFGGTLYQLALALLIGIVVAFRDDYCKSARALVQTFFNAGKVAHNVLERCL